MTIYGGSISNPIKLLLTVIEPLEIGGNPRAKKLDVIGSRLYSTKDGKSHKTQSFGFVIPQQWLYHLMGDITKNKEIMILLTKDSNNEPRLVIYPKKVMK